MRDIFKLFKRWWWPDQVPTYEEGWQAETIWISADNREELAEFHSWLRRNSEKILGITQNLGGEDQLIILMHITKRQGPMPGAAEVYWKPEAFEDDRSRIRTTRSEIDEIIKTFPR